MRILITPIVRMALTEGIAILNILDMELTTTVHTVHTPITPIVHMAHLEPAVAQEQQ